MPDNETAGTPTECSCGHHEDAAGMLRATAELVGHARNLRAQGHKMIFPESRARIDKAGGGKARRRRLQSVHSTHAGNARRSLMCSFFIDRGGWPSLAAWAAAL